MGYRLRSSPSSLLVLSLFLLVSIIFLSCSRGVSGSNRLENSHAQGFKDEGASDKKVERNTGGPTTSAKLLKNTEGARNKGGPTTTAKPHKKERSRDTVGPIYAYEYFKGAPVITDTDMGMDRLLTSLPHRTIHGPITIHPIIRVESGEKSSGGNSTYLILAADRTRRKDPADNFNYYTGGWNITNSHYLYSVAYSAAPPVIVAVVWFFLFGLWLFCICCCCCCCPRKGRHGYSKTIFVLSLCFLVVLTLAAASGTAVLYTGQAKLQKSVGNVMDYVMKEAETVVTNLRNLLNNLMDAKKLGGGEIALPKEYQDEIDQMGTKVNEVADNFRSVTSKSSADIKKFLDTASTWLTYIAGALIVLAILGFLFSLLGLQCVLYILIIIGWILVAATFIMSGLFLLIHNTVTDTCVAVDDYLQNPNANSALEKILPNVDYDTAQTISDTTKDATFGIISTMNNVITNVSNAKIPPEAGPPLYYNQSGPLVPLLCNPYTESDRADRQCAKDEVDFKSASVVWKKYVCDVSKSGICTTQGRLTPDRYTQMIASVNVSYGLYKESPFLVDLIDSTFVKEAFTNISKKHCPDLSKYSEMTYIGFLVSSCAVMVAIVFWIVYARQRKRRSDSKKSLNMMTMPMGGRFDRDMA